MKNIIWAFKYILSAVYNLIYDIVYLPYWRKKYIPTYNGKYEIIFTRHYAIERFKTSIKASIANIQLEFMKSKYRNITRNMKFRLTSIIKSFSLVQYIYWKIRIKAIKLKLLKGRSV